MSALVANGTISIYEWSLCSAAIAVTCGRFYIRWRYFKTAKLDDFFNGLALAALIIYTELGNIENYYDEVSTLKFGLAVNMLMWTVLYLVKASFLALIWSIFRVSEGFHKPYWCVAVYTFLTFWPVLISELWICGNPSDYDNPEVCGNSPDMSQFNIVCLRFVLHITSELLILLLPLAQIRKLHMSTAKRLSAAAVFALVIMNIVTGIIRNVSVFCSLKVPGGSQLCSDMDGYTAPIEVNGAVIVCALPVYRVLLPSSEWRRRNRPAELRENAASIGHAPPTLPELTHISNKTNLSMAEPENSHVTQ